ncbi:Ppx/GppA phosphatase family protein [Fusibacter bizertensis]
MKRSIAIIDLGSNSIRMNIIGINERGGYSIFDQASEMVRLSEGMGESLILQDLPIRRTINALLYFKKLIEVNKTQEVYALATAAVRMAANQNEFLAQVKAETGFDFTVLSGNQEAYYDYLGVVNSMSMDDALILDIGGGSTELIWMKKRKLKEAISLPFGSVTLTERFSNIKNKKKRIEAAHKYIDKYLDQLPWLKALKGKTVIGLGGVIRTLGKIDRDLNGYPIENMHNYRMHEGEVDTIFNMILSTDTKELDKISGISKKRADIITLGIMPFKCIFERINAPEIRISGNGLRDGYFYEKYFPSINQPIIVNDVLLQSKQNMIRRFDINEKHAKHVQFLALKLYESLSPYTQYNQTDKKILSTAALLHDIGIHIEYYDHHIHGFYLILNGRLEGLTNTERLSVAYLVGSHREAGIKSRMTDFENILSRAEITRLGKLVVLLNIAEQLDRAENCAVKDLDITIKEGKVFLKLIGDDSTELEVASSRRFAERFEKQYQMPLIIL